MLDLTLPTLIRPDLELVVSRLAARSVAEGGWQGTPHWLVKRGLNNRGYYQIMLPGTNPRRQMTLAHRIGQEAFVGPIPDGYEVDHCCRTTNCWSPLHTESVTPEENMRRAVAARTACRKGHPYSPESVVWLTTKDGPVRKCRICRSAWEAARACRDAPPARVERATIRVEAGCSIH